MNSKSDSKVSFFINFSEGYNYRSDDVVESDESFSMLNHGTGRILFYPNLAVEEVSNFDYVQPLLNHTST